MPKWRRILVSFLGIASIAAIAWSVGAVLDSRSTDETDAAKRPSWDRASPTARRLATEAMSQVGVTVRYDASYVELAYPGGDVAQDRGACTDVVVRAFRGVGVDLQVKVHEDMTAAFDAYPKRWALKKPNTSIDHRRVPNLQVFFRRRGKAVPITLRGRDYLPGDVVTWKVYGKPHTGVVSARLAAGGDRYRVVHNYGRGAQIEDALFAFPITGHYRYF